MRNYGQAYTYFISTDVCRVDYFGLFGSEVCDSSDAELILTSCEFDAMLIHQETGRPVLALPRYINTLPQQVRSSI